MEANATQAAALALCLKLSISKFHTKRKAGMEGVTVDADKNDLHLAKEILQSKELKRVATIETQARNIIKERYAAGGALSMLGGGRYLIPLALVEKVEDRLAKLEVEYNARVEEFLAAYPMRREEARDRLRALFDEDDYPEVDVLRGRFAFRWRFLPAEWSFTANDGSESLQVVSAAVYEKERKRAEEEWRGAVDEIKDALREAFADLIAHAVERLTPGDDGKTKVFQASLVRNITDFIETFEARNSLVNYADLKVLVDRARRVLNGIDADDLRTSDGLRESVRKSFEAIKTSIDEGTVTRVRKMRFD
jgi:hypothetical protein